MQETAPESRFTVSWNELPTLTRALPGTGGAIRTIPEDFMVREIPLYLPEGKGSHAYAFVRKRELTSRDLMLALMRAGVEEKEIGVAGLKDKYAVTEQWLSVPNAKAQALEALEELPGVEILERSRHRNKLGSGHLKGNEFRIRVRGVEDGAAAAAREIASQLVRSGVPNYFGPQRFGRFGRNAVDGLKVLRGEKVPGGHRLHRFFLSALQSLIFNRLLARRIEEGIFDTVLPGDWARKHDTGGTFEVQDEAESPRAKAFEISALIPLYGKKVKPSGGVPGEMEAAVLAELGLRWVDFRSRHGDRRFTRLKVDEIDVLGQEDGYTLVFTLPKGAYATSLLREVTKTPVDEPAQEQLDEEQQQGAGQ